MTKPSLTDPNNTLQSFPVPEILAPAGGRSQFLAALNSGADAVYLGLGKFNARSRAENFSMDDLKELVPLATAHGMKVLVTLNILIKEHELPDVLEDLLELQWIGIHAVIVQDLGLARIVRNYFPNLRLHASTQLAVHNLAGVMQASDLGFKRVVLARELTSQEIRSIHRSLNKHGIESEIEAFCHGSLCYSYSGLCFFSGAEDARSGNRGECAYTCRQPYKITSEPGHGFLFSMKDLNTSDDLDKLIKAGVHTLKIEGRKKDAQYVASSVGLYRQKLNELYGKETSPLKKINHARKWKEDLSFSFHRDTTTFFLKTRYTENVIDLNNPTHKGIKVGEISSVNGREIEFQSNLNLEKYDGLKIEADHKTFHAKPQHGNQVKSKIENAQSRYENKESRFSLRDFYIKNKRSTNVKKDQVVKIVLPTEIPRPKVGDQIYKIRSNELKRFTEDISKLPKDARLRPLRQIDLSVESNKIENELFINIKATLGGETVETFTFKFEIIKPQNSSTLMHDLESQLKILGDANIAANIVCKGDFNFFIPKSKLKQIKKTIVLELPKKIDNFNHVKKQKILETMSEKKITVANVKEPKYFIKIDRLEYLDYLKEFISSKKIAIKEIIFEPKRAFLGSKSQQEACDQLLQFTKHHTVELRLSLPTVIRAWDETLLKPWVTFFREKNLGFEVGNIGALKLLSQWGVNLPNSNISGDFTLYQLNTEASKALNDLNIKSACLSIEDDYDNIAKKLNNLPESIKPSMLVYKDTPLFIAEACSLMALHDGCPTAKVCGYRDLEVENPQGEKFIVAHESCKSIVYGKSAFGIAQHQVHYSNFTTLA